ncbi:L1 capsid protein [Bos taurus papillomavirus 17]|uniref:Major capsid protein L1 n=1 Tax=Bos taurus papillomavirus 17 TaxID=1887215 RepID=A0A1B2K216_9PAPI|nr:L1 capsid protein [Bos taurus papillomavirus 17]ANZ90243.1 L1 capsid protein [Bos taurus papillomavirus 17]
MASLWLPATGKLYLPPATPVTQILSTDEFVKRTDVYYYTGSKRLLMVGHPYHEVKETVSGKLIAPKVSGNQYRVFRCQFPDPNKFTFSNPNLYNPETQRLVWGVRGVEVCRGQPLGIGCTGNPFFNKYKDAENPQSAFAKPGEEDRVNVCFDPKQIQMLIIGCQPCEGEHWDVAKTCVEQPRSEESKCPAIELVNSIIEDGNMADIGLGNINYETLQQNRSDCPLDLVGQIAKHPDFLKMSSDPYGNRMWFYASREQMFARHLWVRSGTTGEDLPSNLFIGPELNGGDSKIKPHSYYCSPSGSLVSSDQGIFNRPYWIQRAQGLNNGIAWGNEVFITVVDNTHGTNFTFSQKTEEAERPEEQYKASNYRIFSRHAEEFEIAMIVQLCIVDLTPEVLSHLNTMNDRILEDWNLGFVQAPSNLEDNYRFLQSLATPCPDKFKDKEKVDQYEGKTFWTVNLTETFTTDLAQTSLGRKFLFQTGKLNGNKRVAPKSVTFRSKRSSAKRRKLNQ